MKKIILILFVSLISSSLLASETFSLFGLKINSILDKDKYKFDSYEIQMEQEKCNLINRDGTFDSICFISNYVSDSHLTKDTPPPIPNIYFDDYWLSIENETDKIKSISAWTKENLITDSNCLVLKNAIVTSIRDNNQSKKSEFYEFYQSGETALLEYTRKTNDEDKFIFKIQCNQNNIDEIHLGVSLSNPYTFVEKLEQFLDDSSKVDVTGFYDTKMISCIMEDYWGMFSKMYIFEFNHSLNKFIGMSNENYSKYHDMFYVANKDENKIHLVERGNNTNFIINLDNMTAHWDTTREEGINYKCEHGDGRIIYAPSKSKLNG